ncbi:hypothetical protein RhiirA4_468482 [Rhizophagus irregularis]|uniref:Crinkler family protein n=1 Tax=Rhizophagus irregularis TaxID=588596 RepID=A0A2I1GXT1_9GLOM|nr:hypothetical protein RhiirA4_468482 [Rhizophagus irregularis]
MSLNCLLLGKTSLSDSFTVNLYETNNVGDSKVLFNSLKIGDLKYIIYNKVRGGNLNEVKINCKKMTLWKVDVTFGDFTEEQINKGQELIAINFLSNYFKNKDEADKSLIIVKLPTTAQETVETVMDAINIALKDAITSVDIVDDNMPFMERDTDKAITTIIRNINNHLKYCKSKTDYDILVSGGAPGIGKTRYGEELFKHLENNQNWVPSEWKNNLHIVGLYLDFGNGCQLDSYDDELTPTVIIGLRIAFTFFIERKYKMKFETFRRLIWEYRDIFMISDVFLSIYNHIHITLQPNQQLFVFLHIDEFQLIDQWESNAVMKRKMELFEEMINNLASFLFGPPSCIFVQTFLSGTAPQLVKSTKKPAGVSFTFVNCPQLSLRAMLNIANHYAQKFDAETFDCGTYKWMLCQPFLQLLEDTGGLPRALQYVLDECFKIEGGEKEFFEKIYKQHFNTIFYNVKHHLQECYNIYKTIENNEKLALELLYHSIDAIPVSYNTCLDPSKQDYTIEKLERDTHIILNPCDHYSFEFTIKMPFFFICLYNDKLKIVDRELEEVFPVQNEMYWQSWEIFVANYDAFRTNLLIKRGKKSARLGELYRGAHGTQTTLNIEVELKELTVCYAKEQLPCVKPMDKELNSIGASSEAFVIRAIVQNNNLYYLSGTAESLKKEHIKNLEGTTGELHKILSQCQHITIAFTIQPFDDTILTNNCLIIMKSNFKEYFGPTFASRATFYMTKDINHGSIENYEENSSRKKVKLDFSV